MKDIIEKLGIKPLKTYFYIADGDYCNPQEVRELEQQRNEMLEALVKDIDLLETIMEHTYGDEYIQSELLNRIDIVQRIAPDKSLTDIEIKDLL